MVGWIEGVWVLGTVDGNGLTILLRLTPDYFSNNNNITLFNEVTCDGKKR